MEIIALSGNVLLFALVFGMSATVDVSCMKTQIRNYRAILTGMLCQFIVLPFLGFLVVRMLQLNESMGITLLVVTSSPGGSYSNWCVSSSMIDGGFSSPPSLTPTLALPLTGSLPCSMLIWLSPSP
jgi:predicted Na+-dependent transporter